MQAQIDHLIVAAGSLQEGIDWCSSVFGVAPSPGGSHPLMGTHNCLLNIASSRFPRAYLEIIAIDGARRSRRAPGLRRWFDLDDPALQAELAKRGPSLIHYVVAVPAAEAALQGLGRERIDRGPLVEASRDTPAGKLEWRITVRDDGQRLFYGALPTLIQWGPVHPIDGMGESGVRLRSLSLAHARAGDLQSALDAIGLDDIPVKRGAPRIRAEFDTPSGLVCLDSHGI